jgi:PAS domain S-box-containing protein
MAFGLPNLYPLNFGTPRYLLPQNRPVVKARLQASGEEAFRGLLQAAPDAIVVVDRHGRIVLVNEHAESMFGYPSGELVGASVDLLVPSVRRDRHASQRGAYQKEPHRRPMGSGLELAGRRKDGSEFPVEISLSPVETEDGPLITAAVRDNTLRAQTERALKAANKELEAFTYSVSHDLRAPIRQIDGFARLLEEHSAGDLDEKGRHYLDRIREGAHSMGRLVDDLLALARIGQQDLRPVPTPLGPLVNEVVEDVMAEAGGRVIRWNIGPMPEVVCDPGLTRIALTNLLSNAVKYTRPCSEARIDIEQGVHDGYQTIMVRDNGVGFDMEYADKLFGVFQRLHDGEQFEGQGVGLATVQRIIHKHGGEIWAEARPGEGAAFYFTCPLAGAAGDWR